MTAEDELLRAAMAIVEAAKADVARRCEEVGIPAEFVPTIELVWRGGGTP